MREIKFRAWDKIEKRLRPIQMIAWNTKSVHSGSVGNFENYDIMQFTGLKDKNGVDIYEGDVLLEKGDGNEDFVLSVYFDEEDAMFRTHPDNWPLYSTDFPEVIGNIYENPELLND